MFRNIANNIMVLGEEAEFEAKNYQPPQNLKRSIKLQ